MVKLLHGLSSEIGSLNKGIKHNHEMDSFLQDMLGMSDHFNTENTSKPTVHIRVNFESPHIYLCDQLWCCL